jgi:hypothetical protein
MINRPGTASVCRTGRGFRSRKREGPLFVLIALAALASCSADKISVRSLLGEMADFENLAESPRPFFKQAMASSYSRASHKGGEAWFDNLDRGEYVRAETLDGRKEQVLADLVGPGAVTRFWSANPQSRVRFYFDGEVQPRINIPLADLFSGKFRPFGPEFSYVSGTGGNFYYPLPYARGLKITIEETDKPVKLYYEIGYRSYPPGTPVKTFDPERSGDWETEQARAAEALANPKPAPAPSDSEWLSFRETISLGTTYEMPEIIGEKAVYEWSAQVFGTEEDRDWKDPKRGHNAYRFLLLRISFDGEESIATPLGDFFGSAPGVNPYQNLFFTVEADGRMTSRLLMPFRESMRLSLANAGSIPYEVELKLRVGEHRFTDRSYLLRAQWGTLTRDTWPFFDVDFLKTTGEGKVIGTVYQIANPVLIWWGEGDQKVTIDGESFPSTFGTGTEDDYGMAYGYDKPVTCPYHAQTRVDGPGSGGHISLNRWYVLDTLPYLNGVQFVQEMWHWMPCRPTWCYVIYWYAKPGTPGPQKIEESSLSPVDLGVRENMLDPFEGELLQYKTTGGKAAKERLANCSLAEHLVWRDARPGNRLMVHFTVPKAGRYSIALNLCMSAEYGRQRIFVNGVAADQVIDCYSPELFWLQPKLGLFDLKEGDNTLVAEALPPNPDSRPGNLFGLDYIFLVRQ